jgi:glycosyltransferase involved in cell wall biosynthesis
MKILDIVKDTINGCYWIRNKIPFEALQKKGHIIADTSVNNVITITDHDILHFSRMYDGNYMQMIKLAKEHGVKVVYDIDDGADVVDPVNIYYEGVWKMMPSFYFLINVADLVTTTTEELKQHLMEHGAKNVAVLPNSLDPQMWRKRQGGNKKIRIGFAGSNTHIRDILVAMEALVELKNQGYDFTFVIFGFGAYPDTAHDWVRKNRENMKNHYEHPFMVAINRFEELYDQLEDKIEWKSMCPMEMYPERLQELNLDIGICPLEDNKFNRLKSAIKFYEYAMVGTMVLASNIPPFSPDIAGITEECLVEHNALDWADHLKDAIDAFNAEPMALIEVAEHQHKWVMENRTIGKVIDQREKVYLELLGKSDLPTLE